MDRTCIGNLSWLYSSAISWLCVSVLRIFIMRTMAASTWYWRSWNTRSVVLTFSSCYTHTLMMVLQQLRPNVCSVCYGDGIMQVTRHKASTSTHWHFTLELCCHSNETRAPIANPPITARVDSTPTIPSSYIPVHAVVWACSEGQTDTQTRVTIHISRRLQLMWNVTTLRRALASSL